MGVEDRFWPKVDKNGPIPDPAIYGDIGACWSWTGARAEGYGALYRVPWSRHARGRDRAHRVSLRIALGREVSNVLHACDNPLCVNPAHLREGTQAENVADRHARSRDARFIGEDHHNAKLTEADVREIRTMLRSEVGTRTIAKRFGVSRASVRGIADGLGTHPGLTLAH